MQQYLFILLLFIFSVNALPVQQQQALSSFSSSASENTLDSQEYSICSSITEYYESLVDTALSIENEEFLINLIHLPKESMEHILTLQAQSMGFKTITDTQLNKMPSLIGKHIQTMNTNIYESVESIVKLHWRTVWDKELLYADNKEDILSFVSSFNGVVAKKLLDQVDDYNLLEKIKQELAALHKGKSWFHWFRSTKTMVLSLEDNLAKEESNFLRQHVADIRASLLMELGIQFMELFARIQYDIFDQSDLNYQD